MSTGPIADDAPPCDQLEVTRSGSDERQTYRVFDHVTVYITVAESTAHSPSVHLELFAKPSRIQAKDKLADPDTLKVHADAEMIEVRMICGCSYRGVD